MPEESIVVKIEGFLITGENPALQNEVEIKKDLDIDIIDFYNQENQENSGELKGAETEEEVSINQFEKILIKPERDSVKREPEPELIINDLENAFDFDPTDSESESEPISRKKIQIKKKVKKEVKKPYKCLFCSKCFIGYANLSNHMRTHTREKPFFCKICPKSFAELYTLRRHKYQHKNKNKKPFSCTVCSKMFAHKGHLNRHEQTHEKKPHPFSCSICKKTFAQKSNLQRHEDSPNAHCLPSTSTSSNVDGNLNTASKSVKCSICSVKFKNLRSLTQHVQVHKKILNLPHKCSVCPHSFSSSEALQRHFRVKHTENLKKSYTCTICSKNFATNSSLTRHSVALHNNNKRKKGHLKCPECPKRFFLKENLKSHSRIHSTVKAFSCPFCKEKFRHRQNLNLHIKSMH